MMMMMTTNFILLQAYLCGSISNFSRLAGRELSSAISSYEVSGK